MKIPVNKLLKLDTRKLPEIVFSPIEKRGEKKTINEQNAIKLGKVLENLVGIHKICIRC